MTGISTNEVPQIDDPDELVITTLRALAIDAVDAAGSGYPGTAMAMAPVMHTLWSDFLRYDPDDPNWANRDRFVLSVGHASILLYGILHLAGVVSGHPRTGPVGQPAITIEDLRSYRQGGTRATGHPEYGVTAGVETTTGPLGQGVATSVGMAMAQRWTASTFDVDNQGLFDHDVIALCGDGDLMEGVSYEAGSLAGHHGLANLCWIYDNNSVSIEGSTSLSFTEDVGRRFEAFGWQVLHVADANDRASLRAALDTFRATNDRPTLIIVTSTIGWGSPGRAGTQQAHGMPFGPEEARATKQVYRWPTDPTFIIPDKARAHVQATLCDRGRAARSQWDAELAKYRKIHPDRAALFDDMRAGRLPIGWDSSVPVFEPDEVGLPSRMASGQVVNTVGPQIPWLVGGAADTGLPSATLMWFEGAGGFQPDQPGGRNFHFGVREHAMAAIANGLALSGLRVYDATYLIFSDYARGSIRLSALMGLPVVHIFTHDSFQIGADGPTHQPVEQLASYRAIPNLTVIRPADANETAEAWKLALEQTSGPVVLSLSFQPLPTLDRSTAPPAHQIRRGGYILAGSEPDPDAIIIATGGEVHLALTARRLLATEGHRVRVVNLASWELFDEQPASYRDEVLPPSVTARLSVEEGATLGWERYTGSQGRTLGFDTFGASAPIPQLQERFGFTAEHIAAEVKGLLT